MPVCPMCKKEKPFEAFYPSSSKRNKRATYCIMCEKEYSKKRRLAGLEKKKDYKSLRHKEYVKMYKLKNPEKVFAGDTLRNSIKLGKNKKQPCEICGNPKSQGHHDDYSKPLDVVWLCQEHHTWIHS
jgi:hypothetical protein